jgi:hypothetical protein
MSAAQTSFSNLPVSSPFGQLVERIHPFRPQSKAVYEANVASYTPAISSSAYLDLENSDALPAITSGSTRSYLRFLIPRDLAIAKNKSVKVDFEIVNNGVADLLLAPSLFWLQQTSLSLTQGGLSQWQTNYVADLSALYVMPRDEAIFKLEAQGFAFTRTNSNIVNVVTGNVVVQSQVPALYTSLVIPPAGRRIVSYYIENSFLTARGYTNLLAESNVELKLDVAPVGAWASATTFAIISCRLNICGDIIDADTRAKVENSIKNSSALVVPYTNNIFRTFPNQTFTNTVENTFVMSNISAVCTSMFFYLADATASGSSLANISKYVQSTSPGTLTLDFTPAPPTTVAPTTGEAYKINSVTFLADGSIISNISPKTSSEELNNLLQTSLDYKSYLSEEYRSMYYLPFTSSMWRSVLNKAVGAAGAQRFSNSCTLRFTTDQNLTNTSLYVNFQSVAMLIAEAGKLNFHTL